MTDFKCAIEDAGRPGRTRCQNECPSCMQQNLAGADGRVLTTCETFSGRYFDFDDPRPEQISLEDVAVHLAQTCRFGSATTQFYSVAQHALLVRDTVGEWGHPELCLPALHHDSHEFMLGDWPTPLKRKLRAAGVTVLDEMVAKTNVAIGRKFGIDPEMFDHPIIKEADTLALYREAAALKKSRGVGSHWGRAEAAQPIPLLRTSPGRVALEFVATHRRDGGIL